jgi:hypothetical protein
VVGVAGNADSLESLVDGGAPFADVVEYLSREFAPLRPIDLLRVLQEQLGIPFTKSREILEFYNPDMSPAVGAEIINERGEAILALWNKRKDR